MEYRNFLERNGYDTNIVGSNYFIDLLEEIKNGKVSCPECGDEMELSGSLNWD